MTDQQDPKDKHIRELEDRLAILENSESERNKTASEESAEHLKWIRIAIAFVFFMGAIYSCANGVGGFADLLK